MLGKSQSALGVKGMKHFREVLEEAMTELGHVTALQPIITDSFVEKIQDKRSSSGDQSNRVVNRVAMMAHLLVSDRATPLWEKLNAPVSGPNRPAQLDQTDGIKGMRSDVGVIISLF